MNKKEIAQLKNVILEYNRKPELSLYNWLW